MVGHTVRQLRKSAQPRSPLCAPWWTGCVRSRSSRLAATPPSSRRRWHALTRISHAVGRALARVNDSVMNTRSSVAIISIAISSRGTTKFSFYGKTRTKMVQRAIVCKRTTRHGHVCKLHVQPQEHLSRGNGLGSQQYIHSRTSGMKNDTSSTCMPTARIRSSRRSSVLHDMHHDTHTTGALTSGYVGHDCIYKSVIVFEYGPISLTRYLHRPNPNI